MTGRVEDLIYIFSSSLGQQRCRNLPSRYRPRREIRRQCPLMRCEPFMLLSLQRNGPGELFMDVSVLKKDPQDSR